MTGVVRLTLVTVLLLLAHACGVAPEEAQLGTQKSGLGESCGLISTEYVDNDDGCDCPPDGDTSCDPDCADENPGGAAISEQPLLLTVRLVDGVLPGIQLDEASNCTAKAGQGRTKGMILALGDPADSNP